MIRYISAHDFHHDPAWSDISIASGASVARAAEEHDADFIVTSDLFNRPLYASDKGGLNVLREIVRSWTRICPVVAVQGTPSHDAPGCYAPLEDIGLVVLRPGFVYYYHNGQNVNGNGRKFVKQCGKGEDIQSRYDAILFGVPELSNREIVAQLGLPADQANAEAVKLFERYVTEFIAPRRAMFPDIPAVGVLHGTVSDSRQENSADVVVRASDIVIRKETLARAGLDRWSLGHFHRPQEFSGVCAGYSGFTGIDDAPWGQTGFVPAMNLVTIDNGVTISRIPYGTPRREKRVAPLDFYAPDVAYWLETDDPDAVCPTGHPWSRVTHIAPRVETQRVTKEQADAVTGLPDLFRLIDPTVTDRVLEKVGTITEKVKREALAPVEVVLEAVSVKGCKLFHGATVEFDISALPPGLTAITGDNGEGKSSLAAFCTPYPVIVGKDTQSGRASAIKDFFDGQDSQINKRLRVNGVEHKHVINVKGAHTQNPRVECYLYIDGNNQLETTSWDEMFSLTEQLYGAFDDYLITSFYVQPQQSRTAPSGLMMATMTDIRDLVQAIAGIDREQEKRFALDRVNECFKTIEQKENWIAGAEANVENAAALEARAEQERVKRLQIDRALHDSTEAEHAAEETAAQLYTKKEANDREVERKRRDTEDARKIVKEIDDLKARIDTDKASRAALPQLQASLDALTRRRDALAANRETKLAYDEEVMRYNKELNDLQRQVTNENDIAADSYRTARAEYDDKKASCKRIVDNVEAKINALNHPCKKCGYIEEGAQSEIDEARSARDAAARDSAALITPTEPTPKTVPKSLTRPTPTPPAYDTVPDATGDINEVSRRITEANQAAGRIETCTGRVHKLKGDLAGYSASVYVIDDLLDALYDKAVAELKASTIKKTESVKALASINAVIQSLDEQIAKQRETVKRIAEERATAKALGIDREEWDYIATMLGASKIPALELSLVTDAIDAEATRLIDPVDSGRFSFRTITQDAGKAGLVDRFDIRVHDGETGEEKSFLAHSPGQKAFLNDSYVKALALIRNDRMHRAYIPIISDEADGPLQPGRVAAYYDMQRNYYANTDARVLVISHAPDGQNYIQNAVRVRELKGAGA